MSPKEVRTNPPTLLSIKEASYYIGISERKLREMVYSGKIKAIRLGGRIILRRSHIDEELESFCIGGDA